jgi:catechol 2,3-dioxygenase-like lactoylglutathione lyase family enzyme
VSTTDPARAKAFYGDVLGLALRHEDGYALVFDGGGATLRISVVQELAPQPFTVLGWEVDDVRAAVRELTVRGVVFERFPGMEQDDLGVWLPPGGSQGVAWFKDPDGNLLSVSSHAG